MLKAIIAANIALLAADQIWESRVAIIAALVVTPIAYLVVRLRGDRISRMQGVVLVAVFALAATDLLDAGLLPAIRL